ncbi:family 16 glycosylhydrolase [Eubacterium ventriosum]|uniref:family 16 glycosylhydrolase n=1 Tax=Eubacterium ventriosum TaxID=39496 RepID=UPI002430FE9D|nr:family 16 glycosylhydrolase [Eubacterium ventriosum]
MRKKILSIILTTTMVLGLIPCIPCVKQVKAESSWKLVWSDEFDGDSLNTDVWTRETGGSGWGNNELQYYTDRTDNSYVSDGTLKIVAKRENYSNCRFTSARLKTAGKKSFKYGKMEARIKVNGGNQDGVWPAFWMMGDDGTAWPWCGELDIMEHANSRNYVEGTIHWNAGGSSYNTPYNHIFWGSYSVPAYYYYSDNNNGINGWHTYGVIWDENTIKWYVDNNIYLTAYLNDDNAYAFRKNHYFLLNLALGSNATGYTGNTAPNDSFQSATMEVDYVRAYSGSGELNPDGGSSQPDTDGYKSVPDKAVTTVGDCTLYAGSWDNGAMSYKGSKLSDLSIKLNSTSGNAGTWGTQLKYPMNLVQGKKYNVTLKFNSTNAGNMHWKNEGENDSVDLGTVQYNVNAGINTKTLQITADSKNTAVMEMSGMPAGTVIDNISISSVQEADSATTEKPTDAATTTEKVTETPTTHKVIDVDWSGVKYLEDGAEGGKLVNKYKAYCESDKVNIVNIQKNADGASVIYTTFPVAVSSTTAEEAKIEGAGVGFPVDSVKEGQNLFKVTLADNSTYDVYLYKEPVKVTTALPTTTQAPTTTAAPTEKATTAVPTTVAPVTTAAPTEKATTAVPTTQAPTTAAPTEKATTAVPTTQAPTTVAPTEKATTAVPTTQTPTTVAPTEKATTVVPTTQTPTTIAPSETGTTTKPETSKETPTVSTTVTKKTAPTVKVPKVKIKKATKKISAKKLKVTLKTAKGVKGYQVMISTSKKFKKAKVKNYKKAKFTIKKLKANKKYFIRVRAYKVVNGKVYYGKWSNRKVKFKK